MSNTVCILNSPALGGAERSFLTQLGLLSNKSELSIYAPTIAEHGLSTELTSFAKENTLPSVIPFTYDQSLYQVSRSSISFNFISVFVGLLEQILSFKNLGIFEKKQIWCNGNKVLIPVLLGAIIFRYRGSVTWHWRDYPTSGKMSSILTFLVKKLGKFNLVLVGNSNSVCKKLSQVYPDFKNHRLYNPIALVKSTLSQKSYRGVIGFAGMTAPWKGLHELYLWSSLYEIELKDVGIKEIALYGKNIYLTKGEHSKYYDELQRLKELFPTSLIKEKGLVDPEVIYDSIDIMLHLSNKEEPFGRVILESFAHGVPCISTGLGGAGELMKGLKKLVHFSYDYGGLTLKVSELMKHRQEYEAVAEHGRLQFKYFQKLAESDLETFEDTYIR